MNPILRPCLVLMAVASLGLGLGYPLLITLAAQASFPVQANGSLITRDGVVVGSTLIAQPASSAGWFWSRPSAVDWNAAGSGGTNLAPVSPVQREIWTQQAARWRASGIKGTLPADLVTASGSGLDPDLSPAAVRLQIPRVAAARGLDPGLVAVLVESHVRGPQLGLLGTERVNVLELNLALASVRGWGR